jgi:ATP-dependent helicase HepA
MLGKEINRLKALRGVNPNVRDEEIYYFQRQWAELNQVLDSATFHIDALRLLIST